MLHSTATLTAQGDIGIGTFTAEDGSTVDITSSSGGLTSETWDVDDSDITAMVHGTIVLDDVTITTGSDVRLTSTAGGLTSGNWDVDDSDIDGERA